MLKEGKAEKLNRAKEQNFGGEEREEMKNLELNKYFSAILSGDCHDQRSLWSDSAT